VPWNKFTRLLSISGAKWRKNEKIDGKDSPPPCYDNQRQETLSMNSPMPSTSMLCDQVQAVPQHIQMQEPSKLLNVADDRLSPNIFLNLNFDNTSTLDSNVNSLKFEWSSFNPNVTTTTAPSIMSPVPSNKQQMSYMGGSPTYEFLNVDHHFNIDNFKNECILTLDHNLLNSVGDTGLMSSAECQSLDLQQYSLNDDPKELLDLEKPININVTNLDNEKY
jgi:predicted extracellular nuclease